MLVGLQCFRQRIVVRQCAAQGIAVLWNIGGRIKIGVVERGAQSADVMSVPVFPCLFHLLAVKVVAYACIVLVHIIIYHIALPVDDRYTQSLQAVFLHIFVNGAFRLLMQLGQRLNHHPVVVLQAGIEQVDLELALPVVLEDDERGSKYQKH